MMSSLLFDHYGLFGLPEPADLTRIVGAMFLLAGVVLVRFCRVEQRVMRAGPSGYDRQRNGGAEDVVGVVTPLGFDEPLGVGTVASRDTVGVVGSQKVRISAGQSRRVERLARCACPLPVSLLRELVWTIAERGENFDEHMIAT